MVFQIAAKCAPDEKILSDVQKAGLGAVELYLSRDMLRAPDAVLRAARKFDLTYAVHAPTDDVEPEALKYLVQELHSRIVVFHDILWEDEWPALVETFKGVDTRLCVENITGVHEATKFIRRYGFGRCLDLEHVQFQIIGLFSDEVAGIISTAAHIHVSGYTVGSDRWHTHVHHAPEHGVRLFDLIAGAGYTGMVVSEARVAYQRLEEFVKLKEFYDAWRQKRSGQ